jgi:hypothetical protein
MYGNFSNLAYASRTNSLRGVGSEHSAFRRGSPKVMQMNMGSGQFETSLT